MAYQSTKGLTQKIMSVLDDKRWQTSSLISAQIVFKPELLIRRRAVPNLSSAECHSAKTSLVCSKLLWLIRSGAIERRKNDSGAFEYRIIRKKERTHHTGAVNELRLVLAMNDTVATEAVRHIKSVGRLFCWLCHLGECERVALGTYRRTEKLKAVDVTQSIV